jgi:hypothetical protein
MTNAIDSFWIARGVNADELKAIKGRSVLYAGLFSMAVTAFVMVGGIAQNLVGSTI